MRRVASMPSSTGIERSMRTTSGVHSSARRTAASPSAAAPTHFEVGGWLDQLLQAAPHHRVIVDDQDPDHRSGTSTCRSVPVPGASAHVGRATGRPHQVFDALQPEVAGSNARADGRAIETDTVVVTSRNAWSSSLPTRITTVRAREWVNTLRKPSCAHR